MEHTQPFPQVLFYQINDHTSSPIKRFFQPLTWYLAFYGTFLFPLCSAVHAIHYHSGMQHTAFENAWLGPQCNWNFLKFLYSVQILKANYYKNLIKEDHIFCDLYTSLSIKHYILRGLIQNSKTLKLIQNTSFPSLDKYCKSSPTSGVGKKRRSI